MPRPTDPKSWIPRAPAVVDRRRLIRQLHAAGGRRLTLIVAQAAQGKTTLATSYLSSAGEPGAWIHIEKRDSDVANVYYLAARCLQQSFPEKDLSDFLKAPTLSLGSRIAPSYYRDRLLHLVGFLPAPLILVFDGMENLSPGSPALTLIDDLIHAVSPGIRFFLLSREMPHLRLQRLKIKGELTLLSNEDLAFTAEEVAAFFQRRNGMHLVPERAERICNITGGWAGGLVLVSERLDKIPKADRAGWIDKQLPELLQGDVLQYFSEEVFSAQPEPVRHLLIRSALLDVVEPAILAKLAREPRAGDVFRDLVRRNLFIHAVEDRQKGTIFRHNRLFRDFLMFLFKTRLRSGEQHALLERAGEIFWEAGEPESAVGFFLRAGQIERAVDGIMQTAMDLIIRGRGADLARWIDALPEKRVTGDAWLLLYRALTRRISGGKRNMADLAAVLERFRADDDVRGQMLALAYLIEAGVFLGADPFSLVRWIEGGEGLLRTWSEKPFYAYAKTMLWLQVGFGRIAGLGALQQGLSACQNAYLLARRIDDSTLQVTATIVSVLAMAAGGDFTGADRALERIGRIGDTAACPEYRVLQAIVDIRLAMNRGDFDRASAALERSRDDIETFGLLFVYPAFVETAGRLALYRGDYAAAERAGRHLSDVAVMADNPCTHALSLQLAAMVRYHAGAFESARRLTEQALSTLPETHASSIHRLRLKQLQGLISLHLGETKRAESELSEALSVFSGESSPLTQTETHLALGLVLHAAGDAALAAEQLSVGFSTAAQKGYVHFLVMRPADVARACLLAAGPEGTQNNYAAHLLSSRLGSLPGIEIDALIREGQAAGHSRTLEAQRVLYRSRLPRIDIVTLGRFAVFLDGETPIDDRRWAGSRPKLLLKAIIVHGCRDIPKDILTDDLWPESSADAAAKSFKVTLHRLRKVLEPTLSRKMGSAYLPLKENLVSLDRELCRVDVEAFLDLVKEVKRVSGRAAPDLLLARCRQAVGLYGGDFLPEDPYLPWAEAKRTALRDHYVEILVRMVDLYSGQDRLQQAAECCKQILRTEPSSDPACQRLMDLYRRQGMRTAALQVYDAFKSHLISDLGVEPDPETTAIYRKLQQRP